MSQLAKYIIHQQTSLLMVNSSSSASSSAAAASLSSRAVPGTGQLIERMTDIAMFSMREICEMAHNDRCGLSASPCCSSAVCILSTAASAALAGRAARAAALESLQCGACLAPLSVPRVLRRSLPAVVRRANAVCAWSACDLIWAAFGNRKVRFFAVFSSTTSLLLRNMSG